MGSFSTLCRAAELLVGLHPDDALLTALSDSYPSTPPGVTEGLMSRAPPQVDDRYLMAKGCFDQREFARAAGVLESLVNVPTEGSHAATATAAADSKHILQREFFLWAY